MEVLIKRDPSAKYSRTNHPTNVYRQTKTWRNKDGVCKKRIYEYDKITKELLNIYEVKENKNND